MNNKTIGKLSIAVTFFYVDARLEYLRKTVSTFSSLAESVFATIVTQTRDFAQIENIKSIMSEAGVDYSIAVPSLLGSNYLLTWSHLEVLRRAFVKDEGITHFMYLEDDTVVRKENIRYWLTGRDLLRELGVYPSFLRYELKDGSPLAYSSDVIEHVDPRQDNYVVVDENKYAYFNLKQPYQGMYLLDREMAQEHLWGWSSNPDSNHHWGIRETAAQGLTFANVPKAFKYRNVVGYRIDEGRIDEFCLIHHAPNNYANGTDERFGKMLVSEIIKPRFRPKAD